MNAVCERFNRIVQETFVDFHEALLFTDIERFNEKLADWLVKYNSLRPHKGLDFKTPAEYIIENKPECNMWWTQTVWNEKLTVLGNLVGGLLFVGLPLYFTYFKKLKYL